MPKQGIDTLLTSHGKALQTGEEIRFTLVKGPNFSLAPDPVNPKAPKEQFPLIAKFGESVVTPNLQTTPWNTGRLYQQDVPKAEDDSDEEEAVKLQTRKRWRARKDVPKRQWVLQEQVEFLETMMAKRQRQALPKVSLSTRYEGMPEHNASQFCIFELPPETNMGDAMDTGSSNIQVTLLPTPHATISFSQPKARKTLSMSEAEMAIEDQKGKVTRFMMQDKQQMLHGTQAPKNESRKRLFGKLAKKKLPGEEDEGEDDVMGDLAFRNRKGGGRARKELLNTLGDSGLKVDADGVLGGNNDSEFGRGQRFGQFRAEQDSADKGAKGAAEDDAKGSGEPATKSNDGLAMADDFYQRDVQAEYEELDFDANEQFDDDDVDVGETDVMVDGSGFAEDEDDDDLDDENLDGDRPSGAEGLASLAGFRLLLAKARGEITPEQAAEAAEGAKLKEEQREQANRRAAEASKRKNNIEDDNLAQIMAASEKSREEAKHDGVEAVNPQKATSPASPGDQSAVATGVQLDENGLRLVTLDAVRKEIWLHHGTIPMKRLMKFFDIKKKSAPDRQNKFREVVKELCTMETDPLGGRMLVLKQHYSNMG